MRFNCLWRSATFFCLYLFFIQSILKLRQPIFFFSSHSVWQTKSFAVVIVDTVYFIYCWCCTFHIHFPLTFVLQLHDYDVWFDTNLAVEMACVAISETTDSMYCHRGEIKWNEINTFFFLKRHIHIVLTWQWKLKTMRSRKNYLDQTCLHGRRTESNRIRWSKFWLTFSAFIDLSFSHFWFQSMKTINYTKRIAKIKCKNWVLLSIVWNSKSMKYKNCGRKAFYW